MTKIKPFKAIRPRRDLVHLVATRPYYTYKKNVLKAKLADNPYTFLHIINPEFSSKIKTAPNSIERFELVRRQYLKYMDEGLFTHEEHDVIYIYRQTKDQHAFTGVIAGASVEEYNKDLIKKHEATLTSREEMFTTYLDIVGFNAEPVLLSHQHSDYIDELIEEVILGRPEYEFTTTDQVKHELWICSPFFQKQLIRAFATIPATYIADGHHRSASSAALAKLRHDENNQSNANYFLSFFIDERKLKILEFNRLVKFLNGLSKDEFLSRLEENFVIQKITKAKTPSNEHQFTMCLEGEWFELTCKPAIIHPEHPVRCLDPEILTEYVLTPILGIHDLKTDSNIEFISGAESLKTFSDKIVKDGFKVGFVLFPLTMEQVKRVADEHLIMPPKSTWVEPKLRSGLTIYNINE